MKAGVSWFWCCLLLPAGLCAAAPAATNNIARLIATNTWQEVTAADMDTAACRPRDRAMLAEPGNRWKHAQTEHFVIHYEMELFAHKVANMAEFYYSFISHDLHGLQDQVAGRSHIFIFRTEARWKKFRTTIPSVESWAASFVGGTTMYLQQADTTKESAGMLAHEMTHLVVNRYIRGQIPPWLNEGLAEYYGEFAFAAFRGSTRNPRAVFRNFRDPYDLRALFALDRYPADKKEVRRFYETSKFLVGFLLTKQPRDKFPGFLADVAEDQPVASALQKHYGFEDVKALEKEFSRFGH